MCCSCLCWLLFGATPAACPLPPFFPLRSLGGGCRVEAPTRLSAAWEEPGGAEFEHIRFTLTALDAE